MVRERREPKAAIGRRLQAYELRDGSLRTPGWSPFPMTTGGRTRAQLEAG